MNNVEKINAVMNTLKLLEMPMSYANADHVLGIYQTLIEVRDDIGKEESKGVETDGGDNQTD